MATYYISPSGNNGNAGTLASPWKDLVYACSTVTTSGNIIHVLPGTNLIASQASLAVGVSIEGAGITSVIKSTVGGTTSTISLYSGSITNGNQHISNVKFDGSSLAAYRAIYVEKRSNVSIYNCTFVNFDDYAITLYGGGSDNVTPTSWAYGDKVYNCIITNCSAFVGTKNGGEGRGAITVDGTESCEIYGNTITQTGRSGYLNGYCIKGVAGWNKGLKIYNNTLTKELTTTANQSLVFDFAIELWHSLGGQEIYGNTITNGSIDISGGSGQVKGSYTYSNWIHDNIIRLSALSNSNITTGILLETWQSDVLVERNRISNVGTGIWMPLYPDDNRGVDYTNCTISNATFRYNIFENIGVTTGASPDGHAIAVSGPEGGAANTITNFNVYNNVMIGATTGAANTVYGIKIPSQGGGTVSGVNIKNNIIRYFDSGCVTISTVSSSAIQYNIFNGNGSNTPSHSGATVNNNSTSDPLFVSSSDLHLQAGSPGINTGIDLGISYDFESYPVTPPPNIGAYESGSTPIVSPPPITPPIPVTSVTVVGEGSETVITINGGTLQMYALVLPANADDLTVTWSVINGTGSASISATGLLTAISNGTVTVKATSNG